MEALGDPWGSQGCASWPQNPKGPPKQPFWHQSGRHMVIFGISATILHRISVRISPGGSHPLNLNFFGTIFGTTNAKKLIFWTPFRERPQTVAMGLGNAPHKGPRGPMWSLLGAIPAHKGPRGPCGTSGGINLPQKVSMAPQGGHGPPWGLSGPCGA